MSVNYCCVQLEVRKSIVYMSSGASTIQGLNTYCIKYIIFVIHCTKQVFLYVYLQHHLSVSAMAISAWLVEQAGMRGE